MPSPNTAAAIAAATQSPRHGTANSPLLSPRAFAVLMAVAGAIAALAIFS